MSFLEIQDLATLAAQARFFTLLSGALSDLANCPALFKVLDLTVAGGLAGWMVHLKRRH